MKYISIPKFVIMNSTVINATIIALHYTSQMVIGINRSTVSILIDIQRGSTMEDPIHPFSTTMKVPSDGKYLNAHFHSRAS